MEYLKVGPKWNIMCLLHSLKHLNEKENFHYSSINQRKNMNLERCAKLNKEASIFTSNKR